MVRKQEISQVMILFVTSATTFLTAFMGSSLNVAMPIIGQEFGMSAIELSWVATAFLLAAATMLVPMGKLADVFGRQTIFFIGLALFTLSSGLIALSPAKEFLIAMRAVQGAASSMLFSTGMPIVISVFKPEERGRVIGINVACVYLGLSLGPFFGGIITQQLGWRFVLIFNVLVGLGVLVLVALKFPRRSEEVRKEPIDVKGALLYGIGIIALMYGFSKVTSTTGASFLVLGVLLLALFVKMELTIKYPILDLRLFINNSAFAFSNLAALINYCATFAVVFLMSLYLQYLKGYSPQQAGLILVVQPAMQATLSPLAGRLSDRLEPRALASGGMALTTLALIVLSTLTASTPLWYIVIDLAILGISFALFSSPNANAIMGSVDRKHLGVASGMLGTMRVTGQMLSMGTTTLLFALYVGSSKISPENYHLFLKSIKTTFIVFAVLCFFGIFASLARGKMKRA